MRISSIQNQQKFKNKNIRNMIHNRSLKDISFKAKLYEDKSIELESSHSPSSKEFRFNIDSALKYVGKLERKQRSKDNEKVGNLSATRSHKKLLFCSASKNMTDMKSPSNANMNQTDRCLKEKNWDNVQVSNFNVSGNFNFSAKKNQNEGPSFLKMVSPKSQMMSLQSQPKRPKILNRKCQASSFSDDFKLGKVLGKGRFGNVFIGQHIQTKSIYAVKQISLEKICPKLIERLIWQIKIQFFIKHQNCLQLYKFYKDNNSLYLILELGQMSLFDLLREKRFFNERQTAYYIRQTIKAFQHLHENGIIHRDLKPENIVLINNSVKLADFGWSIYLGQNDKRKTFCGTLDYVSPEIVLGSQYDEMVDVWSIGVLCYELSTGHAPFQSNKSRQQTYRKIVNIDLKFPKYLSAEVKDFISKLLIRNPSNRMSLADALEHPFLKKYQKK